MQGLYFGAAIFFWMVFAFSLALICFGMMQVCVSVRVRLHVQTALLSSYACVRPIFATCDLGNGLNSSSSSSSSSSSRSSKQQQQQQRQQQQQQ